MSKKRTAILGAGTYGEVYLTYLLEAGFNVVGFFDDNKELRGKTINKVEVLGNYEDLLTDKFKNGVDQIICPIGDNKVRTKYLEGLRNAGYDIPNFVHSSVLLNKDVELGIGVYLLPGVVVMPHTKIKDYVMVSMGCCIAHHTIIEKGCFVSTGVNIGANIRVKNNSFIGMGSTIMTGVDFIGENALIGAGTVVTKLVNDGHVVAGVPAKTIRIRNE